MAASRVTIHDLQTGATFKVRKSVATAMLRNPDRYSKTKPKSGSTSKEKQP